eukprot:TRINITY_DN1421_c2_g1_i1.p1 TRINITY_DN1421_c2_g1~~TRINITY_DN1421_c2_g1_i1.p1  ORF type:complete len:401 (+),score=38.01 TRINITY_DN1421_c2_g1_i1:130-1332(+)
MKLTTTLALLVSMVGATDWEGYKAKYHKQYSSDAEDEKRRGIWETNLRMIKEKGSLGGLLSDLTRDEFRTQYLSKGRGKRERTSLKQAPTNTQPPQPIDWRAYGAVTRVKNQEGCLASYAFAATGSIEGQWFLSGKNLTSLSEQELVSCSTGTCSGGDTIATWKWLLETHGGVIGTENSFPYIGQETSCDLSGLRPGALISGYSSTQPYEDSMAQWISQNGPLSVGVDATTWQNYISGVLVECVGVEENHSALVVGFTKNAWIVKNSWGVGWGEGGYIRILRGDNLCLIADWPATSIVGGTPPPTPSPPPSGSFTQKICTNSTCGSCTPYTFPQNTCLQSAGGGSLYINNCTNFGMTYNTFILSNDCTGLNIPQYQVSGNCQKDTPGSSGVEWVSSFCTN